MPNHFLSVFRVSWKIKINCNYNYNNIKRVNVKLAGFIYSVKLQRKLHKTKNHK